MHQGNSVPSLSFGESSIMKCGDSRISNSINPMAHFSPKKNKSAKKAKQDSHTQSRIHNQSELSRAGGHTSVISMNDSLKPRESKAIVRTHVQQPTRPEQISMESSMHSPSKFQSLPMQREVSPLPAPRATEQKQEKIAHKRNSLGNYITAPQHRRSQERLEVPEDAHSRQHSGEKGSYKSKMQSVKPRVDCWNRSASRGAEVTPTATRNGHQQ